MVAQAWFLTIFNLSPTQNTCLFTDGNKASVCVCVCVCVVVSVVSSSSRAWLDWDRRLAESTQLFQKDHKSGPEIDFIIGRR